VKLSYQKALAENPKLRSNLLSRAFQKRKIKKDYAKTAREAQKVARQAKQAGSAVGNMGKTVAGVVKRHPLVAVVIAILALLLYGIVSLVGVLGSAGSGGLGGILTSSYLAEDLDIDQAELFYTEWETDLQLEILGMEAAHPGYDEYRFNIDAIGHSPHELMAYLTAVYQDFSYDSIADDLLTLFNEQYTLTFTETVETYYADPDDTDENGDYEPFAWEILTTSLTTLPLSDLTLDHLSAEGLAHYTVLLESQGARQYLGNPLGFNWLPYVTSYYGYRVHPISGEKNYHKGVDIGVPTGTDIYAGQSGTVTFAGFNGDYGNIVVLEDSDGLVSKYAHLDSLLVSVGQTVARGDIIAKSGNTGNSTGAHLHLEVLKDGQYLNALYFVNTKEEIS
jgi:murein DD-endopeptidase MepM/ murein hydrolase activator NlpD